MFGFSAAKVEEEEVKEDMLTPAVEELATRVEYQENK